MSPAARLRLFYFLYYGAVGATLPYFAAYLRGLGFDGAHIGNVQMLGPLLAGPVALSWATVADRMGSPARALRLVTLWTVSAASLLPLARSPLAVGAVLLLQGLAERAIVPLVDSVTMELCHRDPSLSYARIRSFGSLGFVCFTLAMGGLLSLRGERPGDLAVPLGGALLAAGYALAARGLPSPPPQGDRPRLREAAALLRGGPLLALLLVAMLHWAATAPFHILLGVHVRELGLPTWVTGASMATGVLAEVAVLLLYARLAEGASTRRLLALAFAGSALRWLLTWRLTAAAPLVLAQLLHGLTFGLFWGTSVRAMGRLVPSRLRATGQALFSAIVFGGGNALGYQLAGRGLDLLGRVAPLFAGAAAAELVAALLALRLLGAVDRANPGGEAAPTAVR